MGTESRTGAGLEPCCSSQNAFNDSAILEIIEGRCFLDSSKLAPPPITVASLSVSGVNGFDPNLKLPHTLEWNVALEQALGTKQMISASYTGSVGRRLIRERM